MDIDMKLKDEDKLPPRGDLNGRERDKERDRRDRSRDRDRDRRDRSRDRGGEFITLSYTIVSSTGAYEMLFCK